MACFCAQFFCFENIFVCGLKMLRMSCKTIEGRLPAIAYFVYYCQWQLSCTSLNCWFTHFFSLYFLPVNSSCYLSKFKFLFQVLGDEFLSLINAYLLKESMYIFISQNKRDSDIPRTGFDFLDDWWKTFSGAGGRVISPAGLEWKKPFFCLLNWQVHVKIGGKVNENFFFKL